MPVSVKSEFLRLDKPDFDEVLSTSYAYEWEQRLKALRSMPYVMKWAPEDTESCNHTCRIEEYPPSTVFFLY